MRLRRNLYRVAFWGLIAMWAFNVFMANSEGNPENFALIACVVKLCEKLDPSTEK